MLSLTRSNPYHSFAHQIAIIDRYLMKLICSIVFILPFVHSAKLSLQPKVPKPVIQSSAINEGLITRRAHVNKYASLTKKVRDPLEEAIEAVEVIVKKEAEEKASQAIRGTTMPSMLGSFKLTNATMSNINVSAVVPSDPFTFGFVQVGRILGPHGIKGEVKIEFDTDFANQRVINGSVLYIKKPNRKSPRPVKVLNGRQQNQDIYLVLFQGIKTRLSAAVLQKYLVYVKSDDRPQLKKEEYLLRDLIGLKCYLTHSETGTLHSTPFAVVEGVVPPDELCDPSVRQYMHSILEIRKLGTKQLCLIPFVPSIVTFVDVERQIATINPPEGLLDLTYENVEKVLIRGYLPAHIDRLTEQDRRELAMNSKRLWSEGGETSVE